MEVLHVIVCDDVRREFNGKEILLGVYAGQIIVPQVPYDLQLCFWIHYDAKGAGQSSTQFRIVGNNGIVFSNGSFEFSLNQDSPPRGSFVITSSPVQIQSPNTLALELKQGSDDEWQRVCEIDIVIRSIQQLKSV